jgi:hypothetical protein
MGGTAGYVGPWVALADKPECEHTGTIKDAALVGGHFVSAALTV